MLLSADRSRLLIVDVQERLVPAMAEADAVIRQAGVLMDAARQLGVPVLVSEQYPKGLGPTVVALRERVDAGAIVAKLEFGCAANPELNRRLKADGRDQIVIAGIEAHVCVLQTALGLKAEGLAPVVVADAVSSRTRASHDAALARLAANGVELATTEMVVFEWLGRAGTGAFRAVSKLIR